MLLKLNSYYETREIADIKQLVNDSCKLFSDRTAYYVKKDKSNYIPIKFSDVKHDVDCLGSALINLGLKGLRIAVIGENRYEWAISYLAVTTGTGIVVPLDKQLPESEIENCLKRAQVSAIIYSSKLENTIKNISKRIDFVKFYINMDFQETDNNFTSFQNLIEKGEQLLKDNDTRFINATIDKNSLVELLFTSGTTSQSKIVMLSHNNICFNIMQQCKMIEIVKEDTFLSLLPIHHVYECTCGFLTPLYRGASVAYCEGLRHIQKNMKEASVTVLLAVPLIFESMYKKIWEGIEKQGKTKLVKRMIKITDSLDKVGIHIKKFIFKDIHAQFGGKIKILIAGAAAIDPKVSEGFRDLGFLAVQGYGLSECAPIVALNMDTNYKDSAAGLPLVGTEVKIVDKNDEGIGEIVTKGSHVMLGYYQNEEATNDVIKDGWFYTGDLGFMDSDNFVHITGRKKNVIITKNGKNVYPEEIEELLNKSEYIKETLVYGKSSKNDIIISAQILVNKDYIEDKFKDSPKSEDEIKELIWQEVKKVNNKLVIYKHITNFEIREKEFEKTTTMKIKRYLEV